MKEVDAPNCGRENELVAFLYGELNDVEKKSFESHMRACHLCQAQTSEFRSIRESVVAWRDESLGRAQIVSTATQGLRDQPRISGIAALRAFFDLSPLWMKGAVGFAAILFCIFTALAVARLRLTPVPVATTNAGNPGYSQQEMNAMVEQRVQQELARRKSTEEPPLVSSSGTVKQKIVQIPSRTLTRQNYEFASARNGKARRPLTKAEREQLASDLRLVSSSNERDLDLVEGQMNQP